MLFQASHVATSIRCGVRTDVPALVDIEATSCSRRIRNDHGQVVSTASIYKAGFVSNHWIILSAWDVHQISYRSHRAGGVFNGKGRRRAAAVPAVIGRRKDHRGRTRSTAIVTQRVKVVAPRHIAARIGSRGTAMARQPSIEFGRITGAVTLNCCITGIRQGWSRLVFDGEDCRGACAVATVIRS